MKQATLARPDRISLSTSPKVGKWAGMQAQGEFVVARPFIKWAGGKSQLLMQLSALYPKAYNSYFEPFLGGGAVFFDIKPGQAFLNDVNPALVACYGNIKERVDQVIEVLGRLERKYLRSAGPARAEMFYRIREKYNNLHHALPEKAAYLIFLNKTCYNGIYRQNSSGEFNVPFGKYKKPKILDENNLRSVSAVLAGATLTSVSFEDAVREAKANDFMYFDPPYHPLSQTSSFTGYHSNGFAEAEQVKLRNVLGELDRRGCLVMLSNSYTDFVKDLYRDFYQHTVMATRAVNCKASGRGKIKELVITNYKV